MMSDISLLYILLLSLPSLYQPPLSSLPHFTGISFRCIAERKVSASRFTEGYCRYTLRGVIALPSAIFCPGKVVPNILFLVLLFVFHDLCFLFSAMSFSLSLSLSGTLRPSCLQCCRLKFLFSWLLMLKVGIQWETEKRKNTDSFISLVVFYVSLVKINSGKLEARASCSLHMHTAEGK